MKKLQNVRHEYDLYKLRRSQLTEDPIELFERWMEDALVQNVEDPTAFTLSTVDQKGRPSSRIILLKEVDERGFHFYTNYSSHKAEDIEANPYVAMNIFWKPMHRQIHIEGVVRKINRQESEEYFAERPRGSQLGAWASNQSSDLKDRVELEEKMKEVEKRFEGVEEIPCPEQWGGYIIEPGKIEFWQGRMSRLHDRFRYEKVGEGKWEVRRLWP